MTDLVGANSGDYDSDEEESQLDKLSNLRHVPRDMFVSGWDDDDDTDLEKESKEQLDSLDKMLLWAVNENLIDEVHKMLKQDPTVVSAIDSDGYTGLHRASYNNFTEMAKLLLQYNANPNAQTNMGWTPLHSACKWGNAEVAELLLQHGADVNAQSEGQQTPLHVAATVSNCRRTATVLLAHRGINAGALNNSEETAEQIARRTGMAWPVFEMGHTAYDVETGLID